MDSKTKLATTATFGAALSAMYAAPELQADVVDLTFTPSTVSFRSGSSIGQVQVGPTTLGLGFFLERNDAGFRGLGNWSSIGASVATLGFVAYSDSLTAGQTFGGAQTIGYFSQSETGKFYVGFNYKATGNVGWFSVEVGGFEGPMFYGPGQYGSMGETVHVGGKIVPEPSGLAGLALLALGAAGVRRNRKK